MPHGDGDWSPVPRGELTLFQSANLGKHAGVVHGFTGRAGGVSRQPYDTLNLGSHVGDLLTDVEINRGRAAEALGFGSGELALAEQVHGGEAAVIDRPGGPVGGVDALVTATPGILLMLMYADCVPIFLYDRVNEVIAVVHSGWKGTSLNIVERTLSTMSQNFGTDPAETIASIGPCIGFESYEVSKELGIYFENLPFVQQSDERSTILTYNVASGRYHLNLRQMVRIQLAASGVNTCSISVCSMCTFSDSVNFYSHRRDAKHGMQTGRMAALMGLTRPSGSKRNS